MCWRRRARCRRVPTAAAANHPRPFPPGTLCASCCCADEDEGFKAALNIDTSVQRFGFYGPQGEKLWARSGIESLHLWEWAAACNDEAAGAGR